MLQKFLLIGLGGSGGKTLRFTWKEANDRLKGEGWPGGMPQGWQFLHIDVPEMVDASNTEIFPIEVTQGIEYLGLARQPFQFSHYDEDMVARADSLDQVLGWRPDPTVEYGLPFRGAGQLRAVGRVVGLTRRDAVAGAIDRAVAKVLDGRADEEMRRLSAFMHSDPEVQSADAASVILISSLGGGSGSGLFLDVIDLLKSRLAVQAPWLENAQMSVLFAADVFADLKPEDRTGVEPNSLAALSELMNASESGRASRHTFIIGRGNGNVRFPTENAVYQAVGKTLASFMTNDAVQQQFTAYIGTNVRYAATEEAFTPLASEGRFSSMGYASLSLGRAQFTQYAAERIARDSLQRLKEGWRSEAPSGNANPIEEEVVKARVEALRDRFLEECGFDLDGDHAVAESKVRERAWAKSDIEAGSVGEVREMLDRMGEGDRTAAAWADTVRTESGKRQPGFLAGAQKTAEMKATAWRSDRHAKIVRATQNALAEHGFDITLGLLDVLSGTLGDLSDKFAGVSGSSAADGTKAVTTVAKIRNEITNALNGVAEWASQQGDALLQKRALRGPGGIENLYGKALALTVGASLYQSLNGAVSGLRDELVLPLKVELARAAVNLDQVTGPQGDRHEMVKQWSADAPGGHLRAAPNEHLIVDQATHPTILEGWFDRLFPGSGGDSDGAVVEVIEGYDPEESITHPKLGEGGIAYDDALLQVAWPGPGKPSKIAVRVVPDTLLARAEQWVRDRKGIGGYTQETLRGWLASPDRTERDRQEFADRFEVALAGAAPLVSVNANAYKMLHGEAPPSPRLIVGPIPVEDSPDDHALYQRLADALRANGMQEGEILSRFNVQTDGEGIEIASFMPAQVHPVVFDSLTMPVQADWESRDTDKEREQFWRCRRARPVRDFVPMAPSQIEPLVRGWFTSVVLGWVSTFAGSWSNAPLTIWTPTGRKAFPSHLLGPDEQDFRRVLAAVIETLPLALVSYGLGDRDPLDAYLQLIHTGLQPQGQSVDPALRAWVVHGKVAKGSPGHEDALLPPVDLAGPAGVEPDAPVARATTISTVLRNFGEQYRNEWFGMPVGPSTTGLGGAWEIRDVVLQSAVSLADAVTVIAANPAASGGVNLLGMPTAE